MSSSKCSFAAGRGLVVSSLLESVDASSMSEPRAAVGSMELAREFPPEPMDMLLGTLPRILFGPRRPGFDVSLGGMAVLVLARRSEMASLL